MLIDSHCHLDFEAFDEQREWLLEQCVSEGVGAIIVPGVEPEQWSDLVALQESFQTDSCRIGIAAGVHPWWLDGLDCAVASLQHRLQSFIDRYSVVAVGECGLDGKRATPMDIQQDFFKAQIELANANRLPLIVHGYAAHNQVLQCLTELPAEYGGVIHGFSGSPQLASQYWHKGFYIGVGGTITYERAAKTRRAISAMPLESLLLETDAPDMPLDGMQGEPNSPLNLPLIAGQVAQLQGVDLERVAEQTTANARRLFGLSQFGL